MPQIGIDLDNLADVGPILPVELSPHRFAIDSRRRSGVADIPALKTFALIDTGASRSVVKRSLAERLHLDPIRPIAMHSASHADNECYEYPIRVKVHKDLIIDDTCVDALMEKQRIDFLIGRDILRRMTFIYNGPDNHFSLHY